MVWLKLVCKSMVGIFAPTHRYVDIFDCVVFAFWPDTCTETKN